MPQTENPVYVKLEDLQPSECPSDDFAVMLRSLQGSDWTHQFDALTLCRSLLKFSSDVFKTMTFHEIVYQVLMLADSLRSSLSKNAIITLGEMCQFLPRSVEPDLDTVAAVLLRKSVETNIFISDAAVKSIDCMCQYCAEGKVASAVLANLAGARSSLVKAKSAYCFEKVFIRLDAKVGKLRELDRVLKKLAEFTTEASPEVRSGAKSALRALAGCLVGMGDIDKLLFRCLSTEEYKQVKAFMTAQGATSRLGRSLRNRVQASLIDPSRLPRGGSQPPVSVSDDIAERLQSIQAQIDDLNWQTRAQALLQTSELILCNKDFRKSQKLIIAAETLAKGLSDKNVNVVHKALEVTKSLVTGEQKDCLAQYCQLLVQGQVAAIGSGNASVRSAARDCFAAMVKAWEAGVLVQPIAASLSTATDKGRLALYAALLEIAPKLYQKRPSLVHKYVIPAAKTLFEERRGELRQVGCRLLRSLYDLLGAELVDSMNQEQVPKLMEVLSNS